MATYPRASLLGLPQELRDQILDYILVKPNSLSTQFWAGPNPPAYPPTICGVNQQLRDESLAKFYSRNTFHIFDDGHGQSSHTIKHWLYDMVKSNVQHIRHLELQGCVRIPFGHMVQKRWFAILLDLRQGSMQPKHSDEGSDCMLLGPVQELQDAFHALVKGREGKPFGMLEIEELVEGFHGMCVGDY